MPTEVSENGCSPRSSSQNSDGLSSELMKMLIVRMERIEESMQRLLRNQTVQDYYSTGDIARLLGKSDFTIREWCRLRRVHAEKRNCGRGNTREWMISHDELLRIQSEGLLPVERV